MSTTSVSSSSAGGVDAQVSSFKILFRDFLQLPTLSFIGCFPSFNFFLQFLTYRRGHLAGTILHRCQEKSLQRRQHPCLRYCKFFVQAKKIYPSKGFS